MQKERFLIKTIIILLVLLISAPLHAFDFTSWDNILKKNVKRATCSGIPYSGFDYDSIVNSDEFNKLISALESFHPDRLKDRDEIMAFWINVYNIFAVRLIRDNYPVKGIRDIGNIISPVWKVPAGKVGGKSYSLDDIENKILRPMNEPGIHFAIVCASVSCPDLRAESYKASSLKKQLRSQTEEFLKNRNKGVRMENSGKKVYLSKIFDWYEKDFEDSGGIIMFLNKYLSDSQKIPEGCSIQYIPYNWELNSIR